MATTLNIASHDTDGLALATNGRDAILVRGFVHLERLDSGTELECRAAVRVLLVVLEELDFLELVGPDGERSSASGLGTEVVAGVLHNETEVKVASEVDGQLNVGNRAGLDNVRGQTSNLAVGLADVDGRGHAVQALEQHGVDGSRVLGVVVRAIDPVGGQEIALGLVIVAKVVVAHGGLGDGLGESTTQEQVEDVPNQADGVEEVSGVRLASTEQRPLLDRSRVLKSEEGDVGQLKSGKVGKDSLGQLDLLLVGQACGRAGDRDIGDLGSGSNGGGIGSYISQSDGSG